MPLIAVVARQAFACGGRALRPGDRVEVSPLEAVVLVTARNAIFARQVRASGAAAVAPPTSLAPYHGAFEDPPRPKKRTYKRRVSMAEPE